MSKLFIILFLGLIALAPSTSKADINQKMALALELVQVKDLKESMATINDSISRMLINNSSDNKCLNVTSAKSELNNYLASTLQGVFNQRKNDFAKIYADTFTEDELQEIIDFSKSSSGEKYMNQVIKAAESQSLDESNLFSPDIQFFNTPTGKKMKATYPSAKAKATKIVEEIMVEKQLEIAQNLFGIFQRNTKAECLN